MENNLEEDGDEIEIRKFNPKEKKKKRSLEKLELDVDDEEKIDPEPCCDGYNIGSVED